MKQKHLLSACLLCIILPIFGADIEAVTYSKLVSTISRAREPILNGSHAIFTANGDARHIGIAFEHEGYRTIHSFQRIVRKDEFGKPQKDAQGKPLETILFYITHIPEGMHALRYRMVIDGLWVTDPLNKKTEYDYTNGMHVSTLPVQYYEVFQTNNVSPGQVRFVYEGKPNSHIRLAGTFNNWDPFMYELTETKEGYHELLLPLPRGTWYYSYYEGTERLPDTTNSERVYTKDGRVASVVVVK